jgi:hypothetical protein
MTTTSGINRILQGTEPEPEELYANLKPVRYRYVMAYLHEEAETVKNPDDTTTTVIHKPGEVMAILPMTTVNYAVGMYSGTELSGQIYLPEFRLDLMPHPPLNDYERRTHPDQSGVPLGSMFECGNRAIYVMRNEKVVWGGILWTRSYTSGSPTMEISAISFDGYIYYRLLRRSVVFGSPINQYTIWYAVLKQTLTDFTWTGTNNGMKASIVGEGQRITKNAAGKIINIAYTPWTGITRNGHSNADFTNYKEQWPYNSPNIELPDKDLKLYTDYPANKTERKVQKAFRGYDLNMVGTQLEEWADTETISSIGGGKRFEYKVVCWFDTAQQLFRQRYVFGKMKYETGKGPTSNDPKPIDIINPLLGNNTKAMATGPDNTLIFDFPGHISGWSLSETMDAAATRVIVSDNGDAAAKHVEYAWDKALLDKPNSGATRGARGWRLYDQASTYEITTNIITGLTTRAERLLELFKVPQAQQLSDITAASTGQRTSIRATTLQVTLYTDPTTPFPEFELGDWVAFAIEDPFYGGKMYLVRRIIGYNVTVVPEQESDYSHETIELELTDDTQVEIA